MTNIYYTAHTGKRNANGHTRTTGGVYRIAGDALENIGEYSHWSGGAGPERTILDICEKAGIDTNGGYFGKWRDAVELIEV